jgi:tetratricopeptide (TPR) repeat protein
VKRLRIGAALSGAALVGSLASNAYAGPDEDVSTAQADLAYAGSNLNNVQTAVIEARAQRETAEKKVANGEILYRMKDYDRAALILGEVIEEFPNTPSYPDALWLRGETFYASHDYLAARRDYRALVDRGTEASFQTYFGRALSRLVDVVLRLDEPPEALSAFFDKFNLVPPSQVDSGLLYAKGKAYYRQGSWNDALAAFAQVGAPYAHQARYFQGLITMKIARGAMPAAAPSPADASKKTSPSANYKPAIEAFRVAVELPPDTPEHRHVIDLS